MKGAFHEKFLLLILVSIASFACAQEFHSLDFASRMDSLIHGRIDSLKLTELGNLRTVQFDSEGWQGFNEHEMKDAPDGQVFLGLMHPIVQDDIVGMNDHHWVVLLHEKKGAKIYLATISSQGVPMEGFLLHDRFGYLYEKTFRSYSFEHPVHFNPAEQAFEFFSSPMDTSAFQPSRVLRKTPSTTNPFIVLASMKEGKLKCDFLNRQATSFSARTREFGASWTGIPRIQLVVCE